MMTGGTPIEMETSIYKNAKKGDPEKIMGKT